MARRLPPAAALCIIGAVILGQLSDTAVASAAAAACTAWGGEGGLSTAAVAAELRRVRRASARGGRDAPSGSKEPLPPLCFVLREDTVLSEPLHIAPGRAVALRGDGAGNGGGTRMLSARALTERAIVLERGASLELRGLTVADAAFGGLASYGGDVRVVGCAFLNNTVASQLRAPAEQHGWREALPTALSLQAAAYTSTAVSVLLGSFAPSGVSGRLATSSGRGAGSWAGCGYVGGGVGGLGGPRGAMAAVAAAAGIGGLWQATPAAATQHIDAVSLKRLLDESPWLQLTSDCQLFGSPPRLNT
jgi:hypothetical protein